MVTKISLLCVIFVVSVMAAENLSLDEQWSEFKTQHSKNYPAEEEPKRKEIFRQNLEKINAHNKKYEAGEVTYLMGINKFSDLTEEEFKKHYTGGFKKDRAAATAV